MKVWGRYQPKKNMKQIKSREKVIVIKKLSKIK